MHRQLLGFEIRGHLPVQKRARLGPVKDEMVVSRDHHHGTRLGTINEVDPGTGSGYLFGTVYWITFQDGTTDQLLEKEFDKATSFLFTVKTKKARQRLPAQSSLI